MQEMRQPEQYLVPRGAARPEFLKYHIAVQLTCNVSCFSRTSESMLADSYWHLNRVQVHGLHRFSSIVSFPFQLESSGSARHVSIPNAKVRARACCCSRCWWKSKCEQRLKSKDMWTADCFRFQLFKQGQKGTYSKGMMKQRWKSRSDVSWIQILHCHNAQKLGTQFRELQYGLDLWTGVLLCYSLQNASFFDSQIKWALFQTVCIFEASGLKFLNPHSVWSQPHTPVHWIDVYRYNQM